MSVGVGVISSFRENNALVHFQTVISFKILSGHKTWRGQVNSVPCLRLDVGGAREGFYGPVSGICPVFYSHWSLRQLEFLRDS